MCRGERGSARCKISFFVINVFIVFSCNYVLVNGLKIQTPLSHEIFEDPTAANNDLPVTEGDEGIVADVTEDQFLAADEPQQATTVLVTTFYDDAVVVAEVNDEENELYRAKRDADDAPQTTLGPDDFPDFRRPTTPDPNEIAEDSSSLVTELEDIRKILMQEEGVNATGDYVRGRNSCKCGVPANRIVGGTIASIKDYPWTVGLTRGGRPYCGGSLINSRYIVTASHCVDGQSANRISVVIGEQDYASAVDGANPQRYGVAQIIMHEHYNSKTIDNDVALLRLSQPIRLGGTSLHL